MTVSRRKFLTLRVAPPAWPERQAQVVVDPGDLFAPVEAAARARGHDAALSIFAFAFSPDPRAAIAALFDEVEPGGTVIVTAWRRVGLVGDLLRRAAEGDPPPRGVAAPLAWGREELLRQVLDPLGEDLHFEPLSMTFATGQLDALRAALPPVVAAPEHEPPPVTTLEAPYLLARATRRRDS